MSLPSFASFQGGLPCSSSQFKAPAHAPNPSDMGNVSFAARDTQPTKASMLKTPFFPPPPPPDEIRDADLLDGFLFQPKEPFMPGQFTGFGDSVSLQHQRQELPRLQKDTGRRDPSPMKPRLLCPNVDLHSRNASPAREDSQIPPSPAYRADEKTRDIDGPHVPESPSISQHSPTSEHIGRTNQGHGLGQPSSKQASPLIPSYGFRVGSRQFDDPASEIGDLERPRPLSRGRSRHGRKESTRSFRDIRGLGRSHGVGERIQRPQSKNSNISKKRSRVEKSRYIREAPEEDTFTRKLHALIQENQAKQLESQNTIQEQQGTIDTQELMVHEACEKLKKTEHAYNDVKRRYKQTREQESHLAAQNKTLTQQVEDLHEKLSSLSSRQGESAEKCASFRLKLNEAIDEQQRMYRHSQSQCEAVKAALQKEQSERKHLSRKADEALQISAQKRIELKQLFDEHQQRTDTELQQSNLIFTQYYFNDSPN